MKRTLFILIISIMLLTACGAPAPSSVASSPMAGIPDMQKSIEAPSAVMPAAPAIDSVAVANGSSAGSAQERIVIQNADLSVVFKDPQAKMLQIEALAKRLGGFVVSSNMSQVNIGDNLKVPDGNISIRVPAADLDTALKEIKADAVEIQSENRSGQDVTDKYVDLQSQLKAKQAAEEKLYEILQKTDKAEDTLLVFNQLTQVQSDIEVLKGQINYYEQAAALSAINVRLIAEDSIKPIVIGSWQPQGVARDAIQALIDFFQNFVSFLIWLVIYVIPVGAVVILLMALLWRMLRWFWKKVFPKKETPAPVKEEKKV